MILTREQIKSLASDTDDGFNLTLNEQDALCSTGFAYHDLRDAVLALCDAPDGAFMAAYVLVPRIREVVARVERDNSA